MKKRWKVNPPDKKLQDTLSKELGILPLTAQLLINRGLVDKDKAFSFLSPSLKSLSDPFTMKGMTEATERIGSAIINREKIAIYGDYDVDGTTAAALLYLFFKEIGLDKTIYYIPSRLEEGYGLNTTAIEKLSSDKVGLIITVDCGISDVEAVEYASTLGIDCIITDHHEPVKVFPKAVSILNPKQEGCDFPFKGLAGVGVAFNLAVAVRSKLRKDGYFSTDKKRQEPNLKRYLDLVSIGTVADMVPLEGDNRILVSIGLKELRYTTRIGLRALMDKALRGKAVGSDDVAFTIAPRINAAGRLGSAENALKLLISEDITEADALAHRLESYNTSRRTLEDKTLKEALSLLDATEGTENDRAIVLAGEGWHPGVIGIVASRLIERFNKPTVMIAVNDGIGKGSVRGVKGIDVLSGIVNSAHLLSRFGGHKAAAGLTIEEKNIETFKAEFLSFMNSAVRDVDLLPLIKIDEEILLDEVNEGLISEIDTLSPFGVSNPRPLLYSSGVQIINSEVVGEKHLKLKIKQTGRLLDCIAFGMGEKKKYKGCGFEVAFTLF